jgi:hypothetical protein
LLKEGRGEAAFAEGGQGADGVVSENDGGAKEVDFEGRRIEGEDPSESFAADLVAHVLRVGKGADNDFAIPVVPPAQDHAPPMQGGIPRDDGDVRGAGFASEEGSV